MIVLTRAEVYEKYAAQLVRFATGLVGPADGPDIVSSAVIGATWSKGWESVVNERSYLYKAVLNEARRHYRCGKRRNERERLTAGNHESALLAEVRPDVAAAVSATTAGLIAVGSDGSVGRAAVWVFDDDR